MNKELEQKIVEMKFDNSDFEQKVAQSLVTLGKLKESTKLEDAGKGLDNLSKSAKNLDLSHIANGIEQLNARFSNLGIIGMTVMQRLTNAAIDMGQKIGAAITEAPRDGWKEYELNLDSVKTILNSAKTANGLPVTLDQVNQKLAELNAYSDKTIYSFSDMTNNIGKFTNAGVDLDSAVTAIQGVANVAALAGANASDASRAMYNFGQALGSGSVKLIDWKSIENANMATVDFKEQLIQTAEELGTVRKEGDKYVSTTKNMQGKISDAFDATQGFNDSLSAQWMTSEVLTKTLAKYTDETTDLGKAALEAATQVTTFSKLIDTLKESMGSGWMQTWQYIFGDFEESKQLWTGIYNELDGIIQKVSGARNEFLKGWKEAGGRDALLGSIANIWTTLKYYVGLITDAFATAFPKIDATPIVAISKGFNAFTEKIKPAVETVENVTEKVNETAEAVGDVAERAEKFNEIVQQIINGDWGNGQERIDRLHEAGYAFENLQNAVNEILGCEKRYETVMSDNEAVGLSVNEVLSENAEILTDQAKGVEAVTDEVAKQNPIVANLAKILLGVSSTVKVIKKAASGLWGTIAKGVSVLDVIRKGFGFLLDVLGTIGGKLYAFNSWILSFSNFYGVLNGARMRLSQMSDRLKDTGISFKALIDFVELLRKGLGKAERKVVEFFKKLKDGAKSVGFDGLKTALISIGKFIGGALLVSLNALADIIVRVYNAAKDLKDTLAGLPIIQRIAGYIQKLWGELKGLVGSMKDANFYVTVLAPIISGISNTLNRLGTAILPILGSIFEEIKKKLVEIATNAEELYNKLKEDGTLEKATTAFEDFKAALRDIPELITAFYNALKLGRLPLLEELPESAKNFVTSFTDLKTLVQTKLDEKFASWLTTISEWFKKAPTEEEVGPFAGFVNKLKTAFEEFKTTAETAGGAVALFSTKVADVLNKIDFRGGVVTALIGSIAIFVFRWSKVGKSASKTLKALATFIKNGGQVAKSASSKYDAFLKIAAAIGILAGSIWLIASIPADRFREACIALGVGFAAMAGMITALSVMQIPEGKMKEIGTAFGGLGVGLLAISVAAKILATMDLPQLVKGGGALVVFMILMTKAVKAAGNIGPGAGAAFAGLGLALLLLAPSIKLFSTMDAHTLIKGGAAVFVFMQMIARSAKAAGDAKGAFGAFLGISLALLLLIPSIKMLSNMDAGTLLKGGAAVVALMFMMAEAAKRANGGSKGFLGMAVAIAVITGAMYVLAGLPWAALFMSAKSLSMVLDSVGEALSKVGKMKFTEILKGVFGLTAAIAAISVALYLLSEKGDSTEQLKSALGITAILVAFGLMAPAIETLSKIPFQAGVVAAGNAMVFFGAMVICLGALGEISQLGGGRAGDAIVEGCTLIGRAISGFLDGFVGDTFNGVGETVSSIGEHLSSFGQSIGGFIDSLSTVDEQTVTNAKNLALAILAICGADLLDALTGWLRGSKDLGSFSESLEPLAKAVVAMNNALADETLDSEKIGQMADIITKMSELAQSLPSTGGILQKLVGVKDLGTFAADMKEFMEGGFKDFIASLESMDLSLTLIPKMMVIQQTTSAMIDLANSLPKSGIISTLIDGTADLGEFATSMAEFLGYDKYGLFVTRVSLVSEADLGKLRGNIIPATQEMINLASKIKANTSIIDAITGRTNLGKFGETLADFGGGIKKFSDSIADVSTFKMTGITDTLFRLADLNASSNAKGNGLSSFGSSVVTIGHALKSLNTDTKDMSPETISTMISSLTNLHNLLVILAATDYSGVDNFIAAMQRLGSLGIAAFVEEFSANTEAATTAIKGFVTAVTEAFGGDMEGVKSSARSLIVTYTTELAYTGGKQLMMAAGETMVSNMLFGISRKGEDITTSALGVVKAYSLLIIGPASIAYMKAAGEGMISALLRGITSKTPDLIRSARTVVVTYSIGITTAANSSAYQAGKSMARSALDGADEKTDDFYDLGQDAAEGYARGIRSKAREAADEAREMVADAIKAAQRAQDSASPSKKFRKLGRDGGTGYGLGFGDMVSMVVESVTDMGNAGLMAMQDTISHIKDGLDTGLDFNPVITPVLDLSDMMNGMSMANTMLSSFNPDGLTAAAAISIGAQQNEALAQSKAAQQQIDYTQNLAALLNNTKQIINAVEKNRYAVIDGDEVFTYVDRRMGMA